MLSGRFMCYKCPSPSGALNSHCSILAGVLSLAVIRFLAMKTINGQIEATNEGSRYLQAEMPLFVGLDDFHLRTGLCSRNPVIIDFVKTIKLQK
jgi:hypothetical protein